MSRLRDWIIRLRIVYLRRLGMDVSSSARLSLSALLDKTNPKGIHVGAETFVARGAIILSHDFTRKLHVDTFIGERCFVGVNAIVMPGVVIGDEVIIGAGSVVTKSIPPNCIVAGNPACIIKSEIKVTRFGQLSEF
jgi:acetyltransferase-like isoleucine patch superfamily enzyme